LSGGRQRQLAWLFALLTVAMLIVGAVALARESDLVVVLVLVPLFGVLALAFGISARNQ